MALGAVLAAALTDHSAHPYSLFINGLDVLKQLGVGGNRYGVPIDTIQVDEAGAGSVSSMSFVVDDPTAVLTFTQGDEVRYYDHVLDRPIFTGWVMTPTVRSAFGGQGRTIAVQCIGAEAILDWTIVPAVTFPAGGLLGGSTPLADIIQSLCGQAMWGAPGGLRVGMVPGAFVTRGSQANPLSNMEAAFPTPLVPFTTPAGTLRAAIQAVCDMSRGDGMDPTFAGGRIYITVDFYLGLRGWVQVTPAQVPSDYATMTVGVPESAESSVDGGSVVRAVYVLGGNAAGTGIVTDGSGKPGQIVTLSDATILARTDRDARALAIMVGSTAELAGKVAQTDFSAPVDVWAGSKLTLVSPNTGASGDYTITGIAKRFQPSGRQDWSVSYGALPPSAARLLRQLTRATLS